MQSYDAQKAARVWQRVQSGQEASTEPKREQPRMGNLQELIMNEWDAAATYLQLARRMGPREAQMLQKLVREKHTHAASLKGIHHLITGEQAVTSSPRPESGTPQIVLRKCYGREMRNLKEYEARCDDPEYGHVFARLAEQEREHCRAVLELIGNLKNKA